MEYSMDRLWMAGYALLWSAAIGVASSKAQMASPMPRNHAAYVLPNGNVQVVTCSAMAGTISAS